MAIRVFAPEAFFDAEPWVFSLIVRQPDGSAPLDLTGSRLYAAFCSISDGSVVGVCDSTVGDTLVIEDAPEGIIQFNLPAEGRTWKVPAPVPGGLLLTSTVVADLYRQPQGSTTWAAIARIEMDVTRSTGLPA